MVLCGITHLISSHREAWHGALGHARVRIRQRGFSAAEAVLDDKLRVPTSIVLDPERAVKAAALRCRTGRGALGRGRHRRRLAVDDPRLRVSQQPFGEADLMRPADPAEARSERRCITSTFIVPELRDSLKDCCIQAAMARWENIRHDWSMITIRRAPVLEREAVWSQAAAPVITTGGGVGIPRRRDDERGGGVARVRARKTSHSLAAMT
jgi:hypothetical protein